MKVSPIYTKLASKEIENAKQTPRKLGLHVIKKTRIEGIHRPLMSLCTRFLIRKQSVVG